MTTRSEEDPERTPNGDGVTASDDGTFIPRNYYLGIVNGTLVQLGNAFVDAPLVLSGYVYELTRSTGLVGLLVALASAGMLWPQLPASSFIERRRHKLPFYRKLLVPRLIAHQIYCTPWINYLLVSRDEMSEILSGTGWNVDRFINAEAPRSTYVAIIRKSV